ncbi:MAG: replication initiation factor domain-containing protein [Arenibacter sp.]
MTIPVNKGVNLPVRYNGDLLDGAKYAFNIDYLILNFSGVPITETSNDLVFDKSEYGNKIYESMCKITYKGEKFGTMNYNPRSGILDKDLIQLQLENHLFYTKTLTELKKMLLKVIDLMGIEFVGLNRLDLAIDFSQKQHDIPTFLRQIFDGKLLIAGREKDFNVYTKTKKGKIQFNGVQIGKRSSAKMGRIYNKSVEMLANGLKPYISDMWKNTGFDTSYDVWRYEYQMSNKYLRDVDGLTLDNLFKKNFLINLFEKAQKNHFQIKNNTGKKEVNKEKDFIFICIDKVKKVIGAITGAIGKLGRTIKETFIGQQRMVKSLLRSYFSSGHDRRFILPVRQILTDFALWDWYNMKISQYFAEFKEKELIKGMCLRTYEQDFILEI